MTKAQKLIVSLLLIAAILFAFFTFVPLALAEESPDGTVTEEPSEDVQEPPQESGEGQTLVDQFIQSLKDKYGADYERYYNFIIEQWGSVEKRHRIAGIGLWHGWTGMQSFGYLSLRSQW